MSDGPDAGAPPGSDVALRRRTVFYAVPLGVMTVASLVGSAAMPYLAAKASLLLIAMSPLFRHLVLVAPSVDALSLFAVAVPRHFAPDPFVYMLGREYGHLAVEWVEGNSPTLGKFVRVLERLFSKVGAVALLVSPDVVMSTLAGAARVPVPLFVLFNILGTFGTVTVARLLAIAFHGQIDALLAFFRAHLLEATVASVLIVMALNEWSRRSAKAANEDAGG